MKLSKINFLVWAIFALASGCFSQTPPAQTLSVSGLRESVIVKRDNRGIPYIDARNESDLYFAQGYVTAQDRLWQMDLLRRLASGETAEIFGKVSLEQDKYWRKFGFKQVIAAGMKNVKPEFKSALENYARGVNAYLATLDDKTLPTEFRILQFRPAEWKPGDSLLVGAIFSEALSTTWQQDLLKKSLQNFPKEKVDMLFDPKSVDDVLLFGKDAAVQKAKIMSVSTARSKEYPATEAPIDQHLLNSVAQIDRVRKQSLASVGLHAENLAASNNWVISGKRTRDGKPILANDPHLSPSQPAIWYLVHLNSPQVKVAGVVAAGIPGVLIGHNENIAWGATNVGPDVQDLYYETFNNKNQYKTPSGWEAPIVRKEEIKIRKNPLLPETESEMFDVVSTRNGVVFTESGGKKYALKWTAMDSSLALFDSFFYINYARNWDEFKNALKDYGGSMQNFIYADGKGNIGWYAAGKVPIRKTGDGSVPYDGATNDGEWTSFIPFEELPHLYNPPQGYILTANQRTVGTSYKYHDLIARVFVPFRAKRIQDLIAANDKMTLDDSSDIQLDTFSILNSRFAREIVKENAASDETLKIFQGWDGRMTPDSQAALLAEEIRVAFRDRLLAGNFGQEAAQKIRWANEGNFLNKIIMEKPKQWLPKEYSSYGELLKASEVDAREKLIKKMGLDRAKWTWGAAGNIRFSHPLAVIPLIGSQFTVTALPAKGSGGSGASPNVGSNVSMRFLAQPPDWDSTRQVITTGQSGDPKSPYWADQLNDWYTGKTPIFPFSSKAVEKSAIETVIFIPK